MIWESLLDLDADEVCMSHLRVLGRLASRFRRETMDMTTGSTTMDGLIEPRQGDCAAWNHCNFGISS